VCRQSAGKKMGMAEKRMKSKGKKRGAMGGERKVHGENHREVSELGVDKLKWSHGGK